MQKKKILICGATGFIGRNITEHFAEKDDVEVYGTYHNSPPLENSKIAMIHTDLTQKDDVARAVKGMDIIIQAAATTSGAKDIVQKPHCHVTDNAIMNSLIFRAAHEANVGHVIFFSCSVMYQPSETPMKETDFNASEDIYEKYFGVGWTKVYIEKMCEFYARIGDTKYTVVRHSNIYGPHDKYDLEKSHVFGATVAKVMTAQDGKVIVWGEGKEKRDLLHVDDLVAFVEIALDKQEKKFALYNVGLGTATAIHELVKKIITASGRKLTIEYDTTKPTIPTTLALDSTKAKNELGWTPRISLEEGIARTCVWYKDNITV